MKLREQFEYEKIVAQICGLRWRSIAAEDMTAVAHAYFFFSVQFRESLQLARHLYPDDQKLRQLEREECATDNLSPWPGIAAAGERMDHDEFMRRTVALAPADPALAAGFEAAGGSYLAMSRAMGPDIRAASIASYEDGGLEKVFTAMLGFADWNDALLQSFEHFLAEHVRFDSDPEQGHGALSRHITVDDRVLPLWEGFRDLLIAAAPRLARGPDTARARIHEFDGGFEIPPADAGGLDANARGDEIAGTVRAPDDPVCHP